MHEQDTHRTTNTTKKVPILFKIIFLIEHFFPFAPIFDCLFAIQSCFFSVLTLTYVIPLRCYDAIMLNKRFLQRNYVEIQTAQKLVVNEKVVKMRELWKQSLRYFIRMF